MIWVKILLYETRSARHMSARQLARRSGVSKTHILNIENGRTIPTLSCLCLLADALDVDVRELFEHHKGDPIL